MVPRFFFFFFCIVSSFREQKGVLQERNAETTIGHELHGTFFAVVSRMWRYLPLLKWLIGWRVLTTRLI